MINKPINYLLTFVLIVVLAACQSQNLGNINSNSLSLKTDTLPRGQETSKQMAVSSLKSGTYEMVEGFKVDFNLKLNLRISEYLPNRYYCALNAFETDSIANISSGIQPFNNNFIIEFKNNKAVVILKGTTELDSVSFTMGNDSLLHLRVFSTISTINTTTLIFKYVEDLIYPLNDSDDNNIFYYQPIFTTTSVKIPMYKLPDAKLPSETFEFDKHDIMIANDIKDVKTGQARFTLVYFKAITPRPYYYDNFKYHLWMKTVDLNKYFRIDKPPRN